MALFRELKPGDSLLIGGSTITVESKSGQKVRLRIDSPLPIELPDKKPESPAPTLKRPMPA